MKNNKILVISISAILLLSISMISIAHATTPATSNVLVYNSSHQLVLNATATGQVTISTNSYADGVTYYDSNGGHRLSFPIGTTIIVNPNP